jgi:hypothetical protein
MTVEVHPRNALRSRHVVSKLQTLLTGSDIGQNGLNIRPFVPGREERQRSSADRKGGRGPDTPRERMS